MLFSTRYILHLPRRDISLYLKKKKKNTLDFDRRNLVSSRNRSTCGARNREGARIKIAKVSGPKFNFRARERPIQSNDRKRVSRIAGEREGGEGAYEKGERKKRCVPRLVRTIPSINLPAMCEFAALRRMLFPTPVRQSRHGVRCTPPGKRRTHF